MHRSNPLGWATGALFFGAVLLVWYVLHDFPVASKFVLAIAYCVLLSIAGFWMWQHGQRRARLIEDIPTSKIATAPQGYVELLGRAVELPEAPLVTGISGTPCLWYRWEIARRGDEHSRDLVSALFARMVYWPEQSEASQYTFGIEDGTGSAMIFPYQAEIIAAHRQVWYEGDARYTEERVLPGDTLYVLGDFSTHNPGQVPFDLMNEVSAQISVWRADHPQLLRRFDANRNGTLDPDEWEAMHREALLLARQNEAEVKAQPVIHRVMVPDHDRHFLLSSRPPESLAGHYRFWRGFGLAFFLGGGALAIWLGGLTLLR
jgi:hypothetical protein